MSFDDWRKMNISNPDALDNFPLVHEMVLSAFDAGIQEGERRGMERAEQIVLEKSRTVSVKSMDFVTITRVLQAIRNAIKSTEASLT
jgi:hypothetical protein